MTLRCFYCGKIVSTELPDTAVVRGIIMCPECVEKE